MGSLSVACRATSPGTATGGQWPAARGQQPAGSGLCRQVLWPWFCSKGVQNAAVAVAVAVAVVVAVVAVEVLAALAVVRLTEERPAVAANMVQVGNSVFCYLKKEG